MMNNQQVIDALRYCADDRHSLCNFCPAFDFCDMNYEKMMQLAASRMQNLMNGMERLKKRLARIEQEKAALIHEIKTSIDGCDCCKNKGTATEEMCQKADFCCFECKDATCPCLGCDADRNNFEWRGMNAVEGQ